MFLFHDKSSFSKQFCFFVLFFKQTYLYFCLPNHSVAHSSLARRNWQENYVTQLHMTWLSQSSLSLVDPLDQSCQLL